MTPPRDPVEFRLWLGQRPYSPAWAVTLKAFYGTPLLPEERPLWKQVSLHGEERPGVGWDELFANVGRGGGKDDAIKTLVNFECRFGGHEIAAAPGQRLPCPVICPMRSQAQGLLRMLQGEAQLPKMRSAVATITKDSVEFKNGLVPQVQTSDEVAVVGDTVPVAVRNEWALIPDAHAIDTNLRPALRQITGAPRHRLIGISSSYIREGLAWETFRDNFGRADADVLVVQGSTELFNPNIDRDWLARERRRLGPRLAAMHFDCAWQDAVLDGWFGDAVTNCVERGVRSFDRRPGITYTAAIDAAFSGDGFALAIAHREQSGSEPPKTYLDHAEVWTPPREGRLSVESTVTTSARRIKEYGCHSALADQWSFDALRELYLRQGIMLRQEPWTALSKPIRFRRVRDGMNDGEIVLCDQPELLGEFGNISGRLLSSGGERIEARRGKDDLVHAAVLALTAAMEREPYYGKGYDGGGLIRIRSGWMSSGRTTGPGMNYEISDRDARHAEWLRRSG